MASKEAKRRVAHSQEPQYPRLGESRLERRGFLALLGGAASLALLNACGPVGQVPPEEKPDIPLGGVARRPDFHELRLPASNAHATHLGDGSYLSYVFHGQYEERLFGDYVRKNSKDLLAALDKKLRQFSYHNLSDKKEMEKVAWELRVVLEDLFMKDKKLDVAFLSVRLEVVRLKRMAHPPGGAPLPDPVP